MKLKLSFKEMLMAQRELLTQRGNIQEKESVYIIVLETAVTPAEFRELLDKVKDHELEVEV